MLEGTASEVDIANSIQSLSSESCAQEAGWLLPLVHKQNAGAL